jgi:cytochrome P450
MIPGTPLAAASTIGHSLHRLRRSALNPFFSKRSAVELAPLILSKIDQLCQRLAAALDMKEVVQIELAYLALGMDVVTDYSFGQSTNYLQQKDFAFEWHKMMHSMATLIPVLRQAPWAHNIFRSIPLFMVTLISPRAAAFLRWRGAIQKQFNDSIMEHRRGKTNQRSIFVALLDSDLPPEEKSVDRLQDEAQTIIAGGSETISRVLSIITFHLLHDKTKLRKLRVELGSVPFEQLGNKSLLAYLEKLPYLVSWIHWANRVDSSVPS